MIKYKIGTKFKVCGHQELLDMDWWVSDKNYYHDGFSLKETSITFEMIDKCENEILTVVDESVYNDDWYSVEENHWVWPVSIFQVATCEISECSGGCKEGVTPIFGWIICKICGNDLSHIRGQI